MQRIKGVYDGTHVRLLEPVAIPPETEVDVLVPEPASSPEEDEYWRTLREKGIVLRRPRMTDTDDDFEPIPNPGEPVSDTIIRERR